jgi:formimidoylglutamate deiminase
MPSLWFETALLADGWASRVRLTVAGGIVTAIETEVPPAPDDARDQIAVPGLPNLHSHAFQRAMAGLSEHRGDGDDDFWSWRALMYRFVERITPPDLEAIAAQAQVEMLETGFTRVGEFHYLHHDRDGRPYDAPAEMAQAIAAAAAETGIGLTLLPVFYAQGGFGGGPPAASQRRFLNTIDGFARLFEASAAAVATLSDGNLGAAPHSLRAVTPDGLDAVASLARGRPIHIHIAEQTREVEDCLAWCGQRPVDWLLSHAKIDEGWCLVHATHMTAAETRALAASGAVAGLCPVTEANLGDGLFAAGAFIGAGGRFGVGTDSNVQIEAAQELRLLEYGQRLSSRARNILASPARRSTGARLFAGALGGGAQASGQKLAGIVPGASADIVALDARHPSLYGRSGDALIDGWLFAGTAGIVRRVWRRGECVVEDGRHRRAETVAARYRRTLDRLMTA